MVKSNVWGAELMKCIISQYIASSCLFKIQTIMRIACFSFDPRFEVLSHVWFYKSGILFW